MKKAKYKIGDKLNHPMDTLKPYRIVAYADGYYMLRRPGCVPCIMSEKEIDKGLRKPTNLNNK